MITGIGSLLVVSCLGCTTPQTTEAVALTVGPVPDAQAFSIQPQTNAPTFGFDPETENGLPVRVGNDFSPNNWGEPQNAARFSALNLSTPTGIRQQSGANFSAEMAFSASREQTGLGLDVEFAPRAQIQRNQGGANVARTGAEFRVGDITDRDQRGNKGVAPSWYFFLGADNEALVWNVADNSAMNGVALRDQVTVGDLQAGVAWSLSGGGQMSLGLVERELEFNDLAGDNDIKRKDHFAAFSFTFNR